MKTTIYIFSNKLSLSWKELIVEGLASSYFFTMFTLRALSWFIFVRAVFGDHSQRFLVWFILVTAAVTFLNKIEEISSINLFLYLSFSSFLFTRPYFEVFCLNFSFKWAIFSLGFSNNFLLFALRKICIK